MDNPKKPQSLSWEDFKSLGNPDNAPELPAEESEIHDFQDTIRIHLEKKGRGGKSVSIIKGLSCDDSTLTDIGKEIRKKCGVRGSVKHGEIIIQGNHREKIKSILQDMGYRNIKFAGG